jgi:hypothetical protein
MKSESSQLRISHQYIVTGLKALHETIKITKGKRMFWDILETAMGNFRLRLKIDFHISPPDGTKTNGRATSTLHISHDSNLNEQTLAFHSKSRERKVIDVLYHMEQSMLEGRAAF